MPSRAALHAWSMLPSRQSAPLWHGKARERRMTPRRWSTRSSTSARTSNCTEHESMPTSEGASYSHGSRLVSSSPKRDSFALRWGPGTETQSLRRRSSFTTPDDDEQTGVDICESSPNTRRRRFSFALNQALDATVVEEEVWVGVKPTFASTSELLPRPSSARQSMATPTNRPTHSTNNQCKAAQHGPHRPPTLWRASSTAGLA